jgi:hypothetical protein
MTRLCTKCKINKLSQKNIKNERSSCVLCYQQARFRVTKTITEPSCEVSKCVYYPCLNNQQNFNRLKSEINYEYNMETSGFSLTTYCFIISEWDQESCKWVDIYDH